MSAYSRGYVQYQVTAPVFVATFPNGPDRYFYRNDIIPADTLASQIESAVEQGLIKQIGGAQ